jgi:hypothetical protein
MPYSEPIQSISNEVLLLCFFISVCALSECLERQSSRSINIVGKDDITRQGEIPDR